MSAPWTPRTAGSIDDPAAAIRSLGWSAAQEWCNFVLMRPTRLPDHLSVALEEIRPEAPPGRVEAGGPARYPSWTLSNRSTHRSLLRGRGRGLRIKQFLYDYAPPAFDHPSLWESPRVSGHPLGSHVAWLGRSFERCPGASLHVDRTMIELSVREGEFDDGELLQVLSGLRPVDADARERIMGTALANLAYQSRHAEPPIAVPVGYWGHKRVPETLEQHLPTPGALPESIARMQLRVPWPESYRLDSVFAYGALERPQEVDWVYQRRDDPGHYLRLLVSPAGVEGGLRFPPQREIRQSCSQRRLRGAGVDAYHACASERYGQHEVVLSMNQLTVMFIVKPAPHTDRDWLEDTLQAFVRANR